MAPLSNNRRVLWQALVAFLAFAALCPAQRYAFKHYWQDSGLTNLAVNTINQDNDGFLWVATDNGLFRYNGRRFDRFGRADGLPQDDVTALAVSPGGAVWAGTPVGVAYLSEGRFHKVQLGLGQDEGFGHIVAAAGNTAYARTGDGLLKLTLENAGASVKKVYAGDTHSLAVAADGTVWFGCDLDLCRLQGENTAKMSVQLRLPRDRWDSAVSDQEGTLWVRSESHLYKLPRNAAAFVEWDRGLPTSSGQVSELRTDPVYGVTVPTNEGLALPRGDGWTIIGERQGLASDGVATAFRDREGSLWIGFRGAGLDRWTGERQWENWTRSEGLLADILWGLTKDTKGRIWAGAAGGISMIDSGKRQTLTWRDSRRLKGNEALAVQADPKGRIWFGGSDGNLTRFDPETSHAQRFGVRDGIRLSRVRRILVDRDNTLWVLGASGIYRSTSVLHDPIRFTRESVPGEDPAQVYSGGAFDDDGNIWITSDKGLYRYGSGRWHRFDEKDGLKSASVSPIAISNGSLWVAYRSPLGLTKISQPNGTWSLTTYGTHTGLPSDMIYALDASDGSVWAATDSGALRFRQTGWTHFSQIDGMVWDDCDTNSILAEKGGAWIGTSRGLSHFTSQRERADGADLRAPLLRYPGQAKNTLTGSVLVLPWALRNFLIAWDSVNYRDESRIKYEYRMSGLPWTSTLGMETSFSNLPAGSYQFEVHAIGPRGAASPAAHLAFRVEAPWWQTLAFKISAGFVCLSLLVLTWRYQSARLLREKQKLEMAVDRRTQELAQEKLRAEVERERAESASRHKGEFLANMSHEIRTPMNGIIGMTDLLLATSLDSEQSECAQTVKQCGEHLLSVINDILDYSKIEAGFLEIETAPFDLRAVLSLVVHLALPQLRSKGISLTVEYEESLPSHFEGDAARVRQIVMNFVSNAIKFTDTGAICIRAKAPAGLPGHSGVRIEVSDSGCGIASDKIGSLFQQFVQADASTTRRYGGTGLGLAISKKLAEIMRGSVGVSSEVGKGSTFWAQLQLRPAAQQSQESVVKRPSVAPLDQCVKVLVAEDNLINQKVLTRILQRLGCEFQLAHNGAEAVELFSKRPFDVVLMDCQMPVCDGYEATVAIRQWEQEHHQRRVPVVALTAHAANVDRDRCFAAGMDIYLTKPISVERLREVVNGIMVHSASDLETLARRHAKEAQKVSGERDTAVPLPT